MGSLYSVSLRGSNLDTIHAMRFTLGKMFVAIAMLATALAGLMYHTRWWLNGIVSGTFALYALVLLRAAGLRGRALVESIAFSLTGLAYLLILASPFRGKLVTNELLGLVARLLKVVGTTHGYGAGQWQLEVEQIISHAMVWESPVRAGAPSEPALNSFFIIGHCAFSWLFAALAAWIAGRMYGKRLKAQGELKAPG